MNSSVNNTKDSHTHLIGLLFAFIGFSSFAIGDAAYKWLMQDHAFFLILFSGSIIACTLMTLYIPFGGGLKLVKTSVPRLQIMRTLVISAQFILAIYSIRALPLPLFYTLAFMAPAMSAVLAMIFLKETVSIRNWIAIFVGLCGVCIALKPWTAFLGSDFSYDILAICGVLTSAAFLSGSQILARLIGQKGDDSGFTTAYYPITFMLCLSGAFYFLGEDIQPFRSLENFDLAIIALAALGGIGGNVFLALGFSKAPPALAAPFHYTQIVWAIAFGYLIFGDTVDVPMLIGAALVVASGVYLVTHKIHSNRQIDDEPSITQI